MKRRAFMIGAGATAVAAPLHAMPTPLKLSELYDGATQLSDQAVALNGTRVSLYGFMAPPLRAVSQFFVLTKEPMGVCPFCSDISEWPDDILAVYTKRIVRVYPFNLGITVEGILDIGEYVDQDTGFVSLVRVVDATYS